jgi:hypothetical protein
MARRLELALSVVSLCAGAAAAQAVVVAAKPAAKTAPATATPEPSLRTADGHSDLPGYWTNNTVTPLERPKDLADKAFFTPEEAAAYAKRQLSKRELTGNGTYAALQHDPIRLGEKPNQGRNQYSHLVDQRSARRTHPPMTAEARKRNAALVAKNEAYEFDSAENRPLRERCIAWGIEGPPMMPVSYNSTLQIVQSGGYVAVLQEMIHEVHMIPTDGSAHLPANVRQLKGDSRGHWEGDTLVVDTTNFTDQTAFLGSSEHLHVVERFRRVDANTILYQFTVDDPHTWTRPWTLY